MNKLHIVIFEQISLNPRSAYRPKAAPSEATMPEYTRGLRIPVFLLVLVASAPLAAAAPGSGSKPNIVLVLMDNFGYGEIGVYGGGVPKAVAPWDRLLLILAESCPSFGLVIHDLSGRFWPKAAMLFSGDD